MKLLVSVMDAAEAAAALEGGADIIDAKDPHRGALGAVTPATLSAIYERVYRARPISAALGDAADEAAIEAHARTFATAGALFVKVGFAGITNRDRIAALVEAAQRGAQAGDKRCGVVTVAYADAGDDAICAWTLVEIAARGHAEGVLLDTINKNGPGVRRIMPHDALTSWVERAHDAGLVVAVAGRLTVEDLPHVAETGADIARVRGAACEGGRNGRVAAGKIRLLQQTIGDMVSPVRRIQL
jgi:hypothetical protein